MRLHYRNRRAGGVSKACLWVFLVVGMAGVGLLVGAGQDPRPCDDSGMCSLGISKFWTGDIGPSENLRAMLEAVSFKRELIVSTVTEGAEPKWYDVILQLHWELEQLGFGHFVVFGTTPEACAQLHQYAPTCSCIWDDTPFPWGVAGGSRSTTRYAWFHRWKLFARAGRLGYNLMSVDSDFIFFRDPYQHIKSGPMSQIQLWCNPKTGLPLQCNGGFVYIQNLRPDGPVSWIFKNLVDEQMWMLDDNLAYMQESGGPMGCHSDDQHMMEDGARSALVGRPLIYDSINECRGSKWRIKNRFGETLNKSQVLYNIDKMIDWDQIINETKVSLPEGWTFPSYPRSKAFTNMQVNRITVPNMAYGWPEELGGKVGPEPRGQYTAQWLATLKSDCPDCPWWNDNRPLKNGKDELDVVLGPRLDGRGGKFVPELFWDKDVPTELFGIGPAWLSNSIMGFRLGMGTGRGVRVPMPYAMSHIHWWPDLPQRSQYKTMVRKYMARYNWSLAEPLYAASNRSVYVCTERVQRVLALHPSVDLRRLRNVEEYNRIVYGLLQVAHMTHRTALIPDVPCEAPWLHSEYEHGTPRCKVPLNTRESKFRYPSNLPYAADKKGDIVGGWLRRLLGVESPPSACPRLEAADPPPTGLPVLPYLEDADGHAPGSQQQGHRLRKLTTTSSSSSYWMSAQEQEQFWSEQKRFLYGMAYTWDTICLKNIGKPYAMVRPEFAHWLTQPEAAFAELPPTESNTILPLHSALTAAPGDSPLVLRPLEDDPGPGVVLVPKNTSGWSVADTQALVPLGQLVQLAANHHVQPLLYLGHPVALVNSSVRHARGDLPQGHTHGGVRSRLDHASMAEMQAGRHLKETHTSKHHIVTKKALDDRLDHINTKIYTSWCGILSVVPKGGWSVEEHEPNNTISSAFEKAHLARVVDGKVHALQDVAG